MPPKRRKKAKKPITENPRSHENGGDSRGLFRRFLVWSLKASVLCLIWGSVVLGLLIAFYAYDMPDVRQISQPGRRPSITVLDNDGNSIARYGDMYGQRVTLSDVPQSLVHAIIAIEDRRFYKHFGIDVFGLARATYRNLRARRVVEGGSTITQQLAKNLFLTPERKFRRKVQEMLLALWLERTYTKDQILEAYLNRVYLGAGTYGVDAAAEAYFGKKANSIDLKEAAILAGLLRAPSRFSPTNDAVQALDRAKVVLAAMVDEGYISDTQRKAALSETPVPRRKPSASGDGRYFADWVVEQVNGLLKNAPQDITVYTTLDMSLQRSAERHLDAALAGSPKMEAGQGALITLAYDGAVKALVGGRDYDDSQFNRATQAMRQPGSAFKPFIYLAAIEQGLSPDDVFTDAPVKIGKWSPQNYDNKYRGDITAREALAESVNTVAVRVLQKTGVQKVTAVARAIGIVSPMVKDLSLALGTNTVTPLELTSAYASLANGGRVVVPYAIKEIRNRNGRVLYRRPEVKNPVVVNPAAVVTLVDMMKDVINSGTGKRAAIDRPAAGKTGTSSNYHDAWFLGFTGNYITGVWIGNDDNSAMKKVTGGSLPAGLWHDFMYEAEASLPVRDLLTDVPSNFSGDEPEPTEEGEDSGNSFDDFIRSLMR